MKKFFILSIFILSTVYGVAGASVGAVPGNLNFGEVEPGDTIEQDIYIRTNFGNNFTVSPSVSSDRSSNIFDIDRSYSISEQGSSEWITVEEGIVDPDQRRTVELDGGSSTSVSGEFPLTLEVPEDAEPGLHFGRIRLNADISGEEGGAGTINFGEAVIRYSMEVEGHADRDKVVQDVRGFRTSEDEASIEVLLSNTGTVTTSSQSFDIDVLDSRGENVETLRVSGLRLEPGETEWTNARWRGDNVNEGTYQIDGEVDYLTGSAFASGSFSLDDIVQVVPEDSPTVDDEESERATVPLWLVFMVLALLGVLMWSFDIEPFWILAIVGGLAVASFILLSGVSNYLLVVLLMTVGIVVYGVM